jgi:hypothetical protein
MGVHDLSDVGIEEVSIGFLGGRPGIDRPPGDLRLARPLRLRALDRVGRGAVQGEPRIPTQIRALRAFGIEPKASSPSSKATSIPEIRGDPSARKVAIVLCLCASNSLRTRCANPARPTRRLATPSCAHYRTGG